MQLNGKNTLNALLRKGFVENENKSSDHKRIEFWHDGKLTRARTKFSHSGNELDDWLIGQVSKQICLTKQQFIDFAECKIDQNQYVEILKKGKIL